MQLGTHQVSGVVNAEGTHFLCKYKTLPQDEMEVVAPLDSVILFVDNEFGTTYERDGRVYLKMKKLQAKNGKIWEEIHSGNINEIILPTEFAPFTFFRIPASMDMGTYPKA